jgi:ribosomal protein S18 acetylase RimI-like enzyme
LYVKPAYRGRGIATRFIEQVAAESEARGIFLEVTPRNEMATAFYRRLGFKPAKNAHLFMRV